MTDSGLELDFNITRKDVMSWFENYSHIVSLALLAAFMLYTRLQTFSKYLKNGQAYFNGNDAWYHYRQVTYVVHNWPETMPMDPWTGYPTGAVVGQFGTLFDQVIATVALIVGLGDPSQQTIGAVLVLAPAIIGTLVIIPSYYIGSRLGSRSTGLFAAAILAFFPGTFYFNSLAGHSDHQIAEVLMMGIGLATLMYAITVSERDIIVWEIIVEAIQDRDFEELQPYLKRGFIAGFAVAMYMWVWPPGVFLVGIFATFLVVKASLDVLGGETPEPTLIMGAYLLSVTTVFMIIPLSTLSFSATQFSLAQVGLSFLTVLGALFLVGLERLREKYALPTYTYPLTIASLGTIGTVIVSYVLPSAYAVLQINIKRIIGLTAGAETRTISEAQPFVQDFSELVPNVMSEYGLMFFVALIGLLLMSFSLYQTYKKKETSHTQTGQYTLFVVWFVFMLLAAFTQVRFNYYFALAVATSAAYGLTMVLKLVNIPETAPNLKGYQYVALALVLLVFIPTLIYPFQGTVLVASQYDRGATSYENWEGTLDWMEQNTPAEGNYGPAQNSGQLEYYGTYEPTDDFTYPNGSYGVMSWWDYGHWVTHEAERIPVANPFQQHATMAAEYLLATNASTAEEAVTKETEETETAPRYVMVDWKMVNPSSKLGAPTVFNNNVSTDDLYDRVYVRSNQSQQIQGSFVTFKQRYYESMMVRLYRYHGSAVQPQNVFINYREQTVETQTGEQTRINVAQTESVFDTFQSTSELQAHARNNTGQVGGIGAIPQERIDALEQYRLVKASEADALQESQTFRNYVQQQSRTARVNPRLFSQNSNWVKTFERVEGATINGTGPVNSTVRASVPLKMGTTNQEFTYTQYAQTDENGSFTMRVPYSTTGYETFGPENGYTNTSVRATDKYSFRAVGISNNSFSRWTGNTTVSEGKVVGVDETPVSVELEPQQPPQQPPNNTTETNSTSNSPTSDPPTRDTEPDEPTNTTNTSSNTTSAKESE